MNNAVIIERRSTASAEAQGKPTVTPTAESPADVGQLLSPEEFERRAEICVQVARERNQALSLLSIALDRTPDPSIQLEALAAFGQTCCATLRASDVVGRFSGLQVLALLPATNTTGALCAAERLRTAVAALRFTSAEGRSRKLTASIGIASTRGSRAALGSLRARAEVRRDDARNSGGNRVEA